MTMSSLRPIHRNLFRRHGDPLLQWSNRFDNVMLKREHRNKYCYPFCELLVLALPTLAFNTLLSRADGCDFSIFSLDAFALPVVATGAFTSPGVGTIGTATGAAAGGSIRTGALTITGARNVGILTGTVSGVAFTGIAAGAFTGTGASIRTGALTITGARNVGILIGTVAGVAFTGIAAGAFTGTDNVTGVLIGFGTGAFVGIRPGGEMGA